MAGAPNVEIVLHWARTRYLPNHSLQLYPDTAEDRLMTRLELADFCSATGTYLNFKKTSFRIRLVNFHDLEPVLWSQAFFSVFRIQIRIGSGFN